MKTKFLFAIMFILISGIGYCQLYYPNTSTTITGNNVGIGTNTPGNPLSIRGSYASIDLNANSSSNAYITQGVNSVVYSCFATVGINNSCIAGSAIGDLAIRSTNKNILFSTNNGSSSQLYLKNDGNIGIGSNFTNPEALLDVKLSSGVSYYSKAASFRANTNNQIFIAPKLCDDCYNPMSQANDHGIFWNDGLGDGSMNGSTGLVIAPQVANLYTGIRITHEGNVGIGTTLDESGTTNRNPNNYKLAVAGTIGAKELVVETTSTTWPDYVFDNKYDLLQLKDVESYIKLNNHLPDVPSACEIGEKGIAVGEMNKVLLKKVEELYLYVIQLQKEIEQLKTNN